MTNPTDKFADFDAGKVLADAANLEAITGHSDFEAYGKDHLQALHDAEDAGAKRTTYLDAFHGRLSDLADAEAKAKEGDNTPPSPPQPPAQATPNPVNKTKAEAKAKAGTKPRRAAAKTSAKSLSLPKVADGQVAAAVALLVQDDSRDLTAVLADEDDQPIADFDPLPFGPSAFQPSARGAVLTQPITLPKEAEPNEVKSIWLVDGDTPVAVARLLAPLRFGGGRTAEIPGGHLRFDNAG